jgi:hypothetical protein
MGKCVSKGFDFRRSKNMKIAKVQSQPGTKIPNNLAFNTKYFGILYR